MIGKVPESKELIQVPAKAICYLRDKFIWKDNIIN